MSENIDNERGKTFTAQKPMTDPTADAAKLLPCPFCGASAYSDWHETDNRIVYSNYGQPHDRGVIR